MDIPSQRIRYALKAGKEIDVLERGTDRVMTAVDHPYLVSRPVIPGSEADRLATHNHPRDPKKARCYYYAGEQKVYAVFNLENLIPLP
ncbi:hypothetical protein [Spirosoma endophyticum]|uniref:Uncharacterized protein n=1 Tax=Spirosoma endophyticum TaxID=662367 RepID=A0A1I2E9D8_9BACT|nr:hypothetical protein [Spirosoma endophyticum]SFE89624.1 hypothetical protein SAMN05216167_12181 [Spirosoma endophyticum]